MEINKYRIYLFLNERIRLYRKKKKTELYIYICNFFCARYFFILIHIGVFHGTLVVLYD